tara:strand:+ start:275 stop:628 length:354 start_codon:yes stop_codon:yes gene_type:complete
MKAIFKIEEYYPDTNQIVIRFSKLHSSQPIENYRAFAVGLDDIDLYDNSTFIESLMRSSGDRQIIINEETDPIINQAEKLDMNQKPNLRDMVGKVIECTTSDYFKSKSLLRMRRIEL